MNSSKKLLFLLCIVLTDGITAMENAYHSRLKKRYQEVLTKDLPAGYRLGNINILKFDGFTGIPKILYNSMYSSEDALYTLQIPMISGTAVENVYILDLLPSEEKAMRIERFKNYTAIKTVLENQSLEESQKNKIFTELDKALQLDQEGDRTIKARNTFQQERETLEQQKKELIRRKKLQDDTEAKLKQKETDLNTKNTELIRKEECIKNEREILNQRQQLLKSKYPQEEQKVQNDIKKTFWQHNLHYTFLAGGLLFGVGAYYGHSRIDALIAGIANLWRRNN